MKKKYFYNCIKMFALDQHEKTYHINFFLVVYNQSIIYITTPKIDWCFLSKQNIHSNLLLSNTEKYSCQSSTKILNINKKRKNNFELFVGNHNVIDHMSEIPRLCDLKLYTQQDITHKKIKHNDILVKKIYLLPDRTLMYDYDKMKLMRQQQPYYHELFF